LRPRSVLRSGVAVVVALAVVLAVPARGALAPSPCADPAMRLVCPNLRMPPATNLHEVHRDHRALLLMDNRLVDVGPGALEFRARRVSEYVMAARQIVQRAGGLPRVSLDTGARVVFKYVDYSRGAYWKFQNAARFELWAMDAGGKRTGVVRTGPKLDYCLRDLLRRRPGARRHEYYGACDRHESTQAVTLGISVGWADGYPYRYPQNWIDVTALSGCFAVVQRADPLNHVLETDDADNVSVRVVRLPYRPGPQGCPPNTGVAPAP
jgi:hypothetical protein